MDSEARTALRLHNKARAQAPGPHRPQLEWCPHLASSAYTYAMQLASTGRFQHSPDHARQGQGENLYWHSEQMTMEDACRAWIEEKKDYNGEDIGREQGIVGHYTQIIWPQTTKVGIAVFRCRREKGWFPKGGTYVVARYSPQGNIMGRSAYTGR